MGSITKTFSAVGTSTPLSPRAGELISYIVDLSADFDGRLYLEKSETGGQSWDVVKAFTADAVGTVQPETTGVVYRFRCELGVGLEVLTGTAATTLSHVDEIFPAGPTPLIDVADYGAKGDVRTVTDGVTTNTSKTVTSATAAFTSADIGKYLYGTKDGTVYSLGVIVAVNSMTSVVLSVAATGTTTGVTFDIGTDDTIALTNAWNAAITAKSGVQLKSKTYLIRSALPTVPSTNGRGFSVVGNGHDASVLLMSPAGGFTWPSAAGGPVGILNLGSTNQINLRGFTILARSTSYTVDNDNRAWHNGILLPAGDQLQLDDVRVIGIRTTTAQAAGFSASGLQRSVVIDLVTEGNNIGENLESFGGNVFIGGGPTNNTKWECYYYRLGSGAAGVDDRFQRPVFIGRIYDEADWGIYAGGSVKATFIGCIHYEGPTGAVIIADDDFNDLIFQGCKFEPFSTTNRNGILFAAAGKVTLVDCKVDGNGTKYAIDANVSGAVVKIRGGEVNGKGTNATAVRIAAGATVSAKGVTFSKTGAGVMIANAGTFVDEGENAMASVSGAGKFRSLALSTAQVVAGSGTGLAVVDAGAIRKVTYKVTVDYLALAAAGLTADKTIATLPPKTRVTAIYADTTTKYIGGAVSAATLKVGLAVAGEELIASHDVFAAAITKGRADADMGTLMTRAAAIQGGAMPSFTAPTDVSVRLTTVTANTDQLTQGSTTYYIETEVLP